MIAGFLAILTWKLVIYTMVLLAMGIRIYLLGRELENTKADLRWKRQQVAERDRTIITLSTDVDRIKAQAAELQVKMAKTQADLGMARQKWAATVAGIRDAAVPGEASGAIDWMVRMAAKGAEDA